MQISIDLCYLFLNDPGAMVCFWLALHQHCPFPSKLLPKFTQTGEVEAR